MGKYRAFYNILSSAIGYSSVVESLEVPAPEQKLCSSRAAWAVRYDLSI